jgi:hypothetical protein
MILTTLSADELRYLILRDLMSQVRKLESSSVRVVTIIDALRVEVSNGGVPRPVGGLWKYRWPLRWAVCVVAGRSVRATPPSDNLLRNCDSSIDYLGHAHK